MNSLQFEGILLCLEDSLVILTQMLHKCLISCICLISIVLSMFSFLYVYLCMLFASLMQACVFMAAELLIEAYSCLD